MSMLDRIQTNREISFAEFWRRYLDAHRRPCTRAAHYLATMVGILATIAAIYYRQPILVLGGIGLAFALAVGSHWLTNRCQPDSVEPLAPDLMIVEPISHGSTNLYRREFQIFFLGHQEIEKPLRCYE
jgi:hypothetical protein